ncbi:HflC Membrane protease subunits, stomatin/prohibitin homologs [Caulobacteraceae bacterium]|jgi:regulator of protease activity HflC (stomatin/prohibitin superfamily)
MSASDNKITRMSQGPRVARVGLTVALLAIVLVGGGCTVTACSTTVESGEAGIKTTRFGANPGVQPIELRPGWHWKGIGEEIIIYPTRQRTYSYTREANSDGKENEEIAFADQTGLPMTADVNLTIRVRDDRAAELYARWRQPFDDLLDGQIRNDVRSAIAKETEQVPVSCNLNTTPGAAVGSAPIAAAACTGSLMGAGRQQVIQRAFQRVRTKWAAEGVEISQMEWVGTIRYPPSVTAAVEARTQTEQRTLAAQQKAAEARANAEAAIETARGIAESTRLRGEALRANPEIIQQIYAEKSQGLCPPGTDTCIIGQGAWGLVPGKE